MLLFKDIKVPSGDEYLWQKIKTTATGKTYYIHTSGIVAVKGKTGKEWMLQRYMHRKDLACKIDNKMIKVKNLVAAAVFQSYKKGKPVICKDRNSENCDYKNLVVLDNRSLGKLTGHLSRSQKVLVITPDGDRELHRSVRAAGKALNCSYQTVLDYISGKVKNSVLSGYVIYYTSLTKKELAKAELMRELARVIKLKIDAAYAAGDFWQRDVCEHYSGRCEKGGINCDVCTEFKRVEPQYCKRCGAKFFKRIQSIRCPRCAAARKKSAQRKYAVLHTRRASSGYFE